MQGHPRKVLMVVNALQPGGAETQLMHLAEGLAKAGHHITICCMNKAFVPTESVRAAGAQIVELGASHKIQRLLAVPKLARLARRFEVVHCTIWDASLWGRIAAILARRPVVVADHSTDRSIHTSSKGASRESWVALHNRLLDPFTYATVACAASQRPVLLNEGVSPSKIVYIPNGLPIAEMRSTAADGPGPDAVGLPEGVPVVMQVGVFREEKNQVGALEAVAGIRAAGVDAHLVLIGDGPTKAAVEQRAEELGAGEWAHFVGRRSDVPALLPLADVFVQPSLADAMPLTVMEAMAIGVPVVATEVGDVPAMLEGRAGLLVPPGDQAALEAALTALLTDPARRAELGAAGEEIASGQDSATMVRSYEDLFDSAVAA
ncbi:MAG TPA: glycosyltransferase [Solirubrobacterales bacterium]|nr:glycosyltransferase [Solirubrobacterales bacterium]